MGGPLVGAQLVPGGRRPCANPSENRRRAPMPLVDLVRPYAGVFSSGSENVKAAAYARIPVFWPLETAGNLSTIRCHSHRQVATGG
jgi:hypothetical protein